MWYLIEQDYIDREELTAANVAFIDSGVKTPRHVNGYAIPAEDRDRVIELIGIQPDCVRELQTEQPDIILIDEVDPGEGTKLFSEPEGEIPEGKKENQKYKENQKRYVAECACRNNRELRAAQRELRNARNNIDSYQNQIAQAYRNAKFASESLQRIKSDKNDRTKEYRSEYDKLCQVDGITKVEVKNHTIQVYTKHINIEQEYHTYDIGEFRIEMRARDDAYYQGAVNCFNITREIDGYYHPHVMAPHGSCCFGNVGVGIMELVGKLEYSLAAQVILRFLETANPDDWYAPVDKWPVAGSDKEREGAKA